MRRLLITIFALLTAFGTAMAIDKNTVEVAYNDDKVVVNIADNINDYVTVAIELANVKITQSDKVADNAPGEIYYILSGSSTNGSFYLSGSYKCSCFVCKGHTEFKGKGTLTVNGKTAHGIWSKEYIEIKNCTINVESALKDGINCNQYFLMESGTVNITGPGDDGVQVSLKDEKSTGITTDHEDEDSGNFYMTGGSLKITGHGGVCIKADGSISYTGGTQDFNTADVIENAATGIRSALKAHDDGTKAAYDLSGRRLQEGSQQKGVIIVKEGGTTKKVIR